MLVSDHVNDRQLFPLPSLKGWIDPSHALLTCGTLPAGICPASVGGTTKAVSAWYARGCGDANDRQ